jgi:predicted PurR-regulated permease PerM
VATESPTLAQRTFMVVGSTVGILGLLYWGQKVLIPLALAILLTFILTPLVVTLQKRHVPRVAAVTLTVLIAFGLLSAIGWIVMAQLRQLADELPQHTHTISAKLNDLQGGPDSVLARLRQMVHEITRQLKQAPPTANATEGEKPVPVVVQDQQPAFLSIFPAVAGPMAELLASAVLVIMLVVFILIRREDLRFRLIQLAGHGRLTLTTRAVDEAAERISAYLSMQLTINTGFGACLFVGLQLLGIPFAFLWGFLAVLMRFIPYLGIWMALLFPLVLTFAVFPDWYPPLEVLALFLGLEAVTANVVEPLLFSHSTGVSPIALLAAAAFWTWLWGPIGLLLATPLTVSLHVLGRHVPHLRFLAILLGSEPVMEPDLRFYQRLLAQDEDEAADLVEKFVQHRPVEDLYDEVLLPALVRMNRDQERGDLPREKSSFIVRATRDILDDVEVPAEQAPPDDAPLVVACPARNEADVLPLQMLRQLLERRGTRVQVLSPDELSAEMVGHVAEAKPLLVCIGSLAPGGLAHLRYLGKRLRMQFPSLKILALRWGSNENRERLEQRLHAAGMNHIIQTLKEARNIVVTLLPLKPSHPEETRRLQGAGR